MFERPALTLNLSGHAHALLMNFEGELTSQLGGEETLAIRLRIPLFVGTFSPPGEQALRRFRKTLPKDLKGFLTDYEAGLEDAVSADPRYGFRLRATVELAPKDPDAGAFQLTHYGDMTDDERTAMEEIGRKGQVIVRDRKQLGLRTRATFAQGCRSGGPRGAPLYLQPIPLHGGMEALEGPPTEGSEEP